MSKTSLHISLSDQLKKDALIRVKGGRFSTPTEYIRHLIRQDVLKAKAKDEFSQFIKIGMASPDGEQSPVEMFSELRAELKARV